MRGPAYNAQLTNFAHGIAPDFSSSLADLLAPQCVCPAAAGQYIAFDDDEAFRYIETRRAMGGDMAMIEMPANSPEFSCLPHALGIGTDSFELERVGEAGTDMLRKSKIRTLVSRQALSREHRVFKAYSDNVAAEAGLGTWTNSAKDPIDEINGIIVAVAIATGRADIHLVVGLNALRQLGKHPKVLAKFPGAQEINLTADKLAKLLIIPVKVHVAMMPIALEKPGKAAVKAVIGGSIIYALISQENPSPYDPSAAKTFTTRRGQVDGVGYFKKEPFAEINFMAWSEDIKITGTQCVKRINVATGDIA